jgi:hypothetical protein
VSIEVGMKVFRCALMLILLGAVVGLAGCSTLEVVIPALSPSGAGVECEPSSPECVEKRTAKLRAMTRDKGHAWVAQPEPVAGYANGTRLFAYRMTRTKLGCDDLARALGELRTARAAYGEAVAGVAPAQAERTRSLIVKVRGELGFEMNRRCKTASQARGRLALN